MHIQIRIFMKRNILLVIATLCLIACTGARTNVNRAITLDLESGQGILNSINLITAKPQNWNQARFDSVHVAIISLATCGELDRNIDEDKSHMAHLFTASAALLQYKADSVFKMSSYGEYQQMCKDLKFLKAKHKDWLNAGISVESQNVSLNFVSDLFKQYESVLSMSKSSFAKSPKILDNHKLQAYNMSYEPTKNKIEGNKYYSKYFSNNTAIIKGVSEFPSRLAASKKRYMDELETMIEKAAVTDSLSLLQLLTIQSDFNTMAKDASTDAVNALSMFVENYVEPVKKEDNEN